MIQQDGYYYNQQLKTYVRQFMAIFTGLQVEIGRRDEEEPKLISVPIAYAMKDRVVAAILTENTQNKPLRLPTMSAYLRNMRIDPVRKVGIGAERRNTYTPVGGLVPNDTRVVHQRRPIPVTLDMELALYASNTDQHFQMLEQIIPYFESELQIQTSDALFDFKKIASVILTNMNIDTPAPIGTAGRYVHSTLTFEVQAWIDIPAEVRRDFINKIFVRVGAVSSGAMTSQEMIDDLDSQGIPYEKWFDGSDITV